MTKYADIYESDVAVTFTQIPKEQGYFCAGNMKIAWYMKPNWMMRLIARSAGWRWEPAPSTRKEKG